MSDRFSGADNGGRAGPERQSAPGGTPAVKRAPASAATPKNVFDVPKLSTGKRSFPDKWAELTTGLVRRSFTMSGQLDRRFPLAGSARNAHPRSEVASEGTPIAPLPPAGHVDPPIGQVVPTAGLLKPRLPMTSNDSAANSGPELASDVEATSTDHASTSAANPTHAVEHHVAATPGLGERNLPLVEWAETTTSVVRVTASRTVVLGRGLPMADTDSASPEPEAYPAVAKTAAHRAAEAEPPVVDQAAAMSELFASLFPAANTDSASPEPEAYRAVATPANHPAAEAETPVVDQAAAMSELFASLFPKATTDSASSEPEAHPDVATPAAHPAAETEPPVVDQAAAMSELFESLFPTAKTESAASPEPQDASDAVATLAPHFAAAAEAEPTTAVVGQAAAMSELLDRSPVADSDSVPSTAAQDASEAVATPAAHVPAAEAEPPVVDQAAAVSELFDRALADSESLDTEASPAAAPAANAPAVASEPIYRSIPIPGRLSRHFELSDERDARPETEVAPEAAATPPAHQAPAPGAEPTTATIRQAIPTQGPGERSFPFGERAEPASVVRRPVPLLDLPLPQDGSVARPAEVIPEAARSELSENIHEAVPGVGDRNFPLGERDEPAETISVVRKSVSISEPLGLAMPELADIARPGPEAGPHTTPAAELDPAAWEKSTTADLPQTVPAPGLLDRRLPVPDEGSVARSRINTAYDQATAPTHTVGRHAVHMSGLLKAIVQPDIYTAPHDRNRAIALRWVMRDIRGNRLKLSPIGPLDLQELIELQLVEVRNGVPVLTNAGQEAIAHA